MPRNDHYKIRLFVVKDNEDCDKAISWVERSEQRFKIYDVTLIADEFRQERTNPLQADFPFIYSRNELVPFEGFDGFLEMLSCSPIFEVADSDDSE